MSVKLENGLENKQQEPELSRNRETDWMKVLFQIQVNLSAFGAFHFLLKDSYWFTIIFGEYFLNIVKELLNFKDINKYF